MFQRFYQCLNHHGLTWFDTPLTTKNQPSYLIFRSTTTTYYPRLSGKWNWKRDHPTRRDASHLLPVPPWPRRYKFIPKVCFRRIWVTSSKSSKQDAFTSDILKTMWEKKCRCWKVQHTVNPSFLGLSFSKLFTSGWKYINGLTVC